MGKAVSNEMIEQVKKDAGIDRYFYDIIVPDMPDYYSEYPVDFSLRDTACCPLHGETKPSLHYFSDTNSYYCFGCGSGGDIIKLHREYMEKCRGLEVNFVDAVRFLYQRYVIGADIESLDIGGKEAQGESAKDRKPWEPAPVKAEKKEEKRLSTDIETMRYSRYILELEQRMHAIKAPIEVKETMYSLIDDTELLVSLNKLNAGEALAAVKETERNLGLKY